jgi:predicted nuclease of predicted toxin-antitoxin system
VLAACITIAIGVSAHAQQQQDGSYQPSDAEVLALASCEGVALSKQDQDVQIKSGVYDRLHGQWLIVGEKRHEIISCLVAKHGWTAMSTPDGRRVARAPR